MAIIRLDCNLNGGDSVTPNNELFYRIYGDVDAYASPIHTTGTDLSDANVTVNNDNVIITGVDGATNTTFKIAAVDTSFNEGVLSDASVESSVLFEDDFQRTVIPFVSDSKWDVVNPTATAVIDVDNELQISHEASETSKDDYVASKDTIAAGWGAIGFDIEHSDQNINAKFWNFNLRTATSINDSDYNISVGKASTGIQWLVIDGGVVEVNESPAIDISTYKSFKFVNNGTDVRLFNWSGSAWVQLGTTYTGTFTNDWKLYIWMYGASSSLPTIYRSKNIVITDADYSTLRP